VLAAIARDVAAALEEPNVPALKSQSVRHACVTFAIDLQSDHRITRLNSLKSSSRPVIRLHYAWPLTEAPEFPALVLQHCRR
jgi:hypothetical protein